MLLSYYYIHPLRIVVCIIEVVGRPASSMSRSCVSRSPHVHLSVVDGVVHGLVGRRGLLRPGDHDWGGGEPGRETPVQAQVAPFAALVRGDVATLLWKLKFIFKMSITTV